MTCHCICPSRGEPSGINRIHRLYREEGLSVRKRRARRKALGTRAPILVEDRANARWSLDSVHYQFANGPCFHILNIVDDVDLPPICHPAAIRATADFAPSGAGEATGDLRS